MKKRNAIAFDLRTAKYKKRVVTPKKGGPYNRQNNKKRDDDE